MKIISKNQILKEIKKMEDLKIHFVKKQDFTNAAIFRDKEKKLREAFGIFKK